MTERERIDREMQAIALQLGLKTTVAAMCYGGDVVHSHQTSRPPTGVWSRESGHCELERLLERYYGAVSNAGRQRVVDEAKRELESWKRDETPEAEGISLDQLILEDGEGYSPEMIGQRYGYDPHRVRRLRRRNDRGAEDGLPTLPKKKGERCTLDPIRRREEVARMKEKGMSNRQIAFRLDCTEGTVRNDLKALRHLTSIC